jgi:hypothetical protein
VFLPPPRPLPRIDDCRFDPPSMRGRSEDLGPLSWPKRLLIRSKRAS